MYLNFGTGTTGGVFYTARIGIGTLLTVETYMNVTVEATKASGKTAICSKPATLRLLQRHSPPRCRPTRGKWGL